MPVGTFTVCLLVFAGGCIGHFGRRWISAEAREAIPLVLGLTSFCSGLLSVVKGAQMPVVTFSMQLGIWLGKSLRLEERAYDLIRAALRRIPTPKGFDFEQFVTVSAIFCFSGFGLYSVIVECISGDRTQILSKALLDGFASFIFGSGLGIGVALIAIPQAAVFAVVCALAFLVGPYFTPEMLANFMACGGALTMAAGLRMARIKQYPLIDMLPSLVLTLLITPLWTALMG